MTETTKNTTSRRAVTQGLAWSVPAVAAASAAPAMAATTPTYEDYEFRGGLYVETSAAIEGGLCTNPETGKQGRYLNKLALNNTMLATEEWPSGVSVQQMNDVASPATTATIPEPLKAVFAIPAAMVESGNLKYDRNKGYRHTGSSNWSKPATQIVSLEDPDGVVRDYVIYEFTYQGDLTQPISPAGTTTGWPGTELEGTITVNTNYCAPEDEWFRLGYFTGGSENWEQPGQFTTDTGHVGQINPFNPGLNGWSKKIV